MIHDRLTPTPASPSSSKKEDGLIEDLAFDEIDTATSVLIYTANSTYQLEVIDHGERRVTLSGGLFRGQTVEAFYGWSSTHLRVGTCALFFWQSENEGLLRIQTSKIRGLSVKQKQWPEISRGDGRI